MSKIKEIPVPMAGLILGVAALGNLWQSHSATLRYILGGISAILFILYTIRIFAARDSFKKELDQPLPASVFGCYSMALMLLAGYLKPFASGLATVLWYVAVILHVLIMLYFSFKFASQKQIKQVFASWFIPYVGIAVAGVTAPAFEATTLGQISFYFGLVTFIILLPIVLKRVHKVGEIPGPAVPSTAITCAPCSLVLAAYMSSFADKAPWLVYCLLVVSQVLYFYVIFQLPSFLKRPFAPSFSSFTFPLAISGISLKLTNGYLTKSGRGIPFLSYLVLFEEILALVLILYVLVAYLNFIFGKKGTAKS